MANRERGEVDLVVGDQTYVLVANPNEICELEDRSGKTYGDILNEIGRSGYSALRQLLFAFLQPKHAKDFRTLREVGNLIKLAGGIKGLTKVVLAVAALNRPPLTNEGATGGAADPPAAQAGTGAGSPETPAASA